GRAAKLLRAEPSRGDTFPANLDSFWVKSLAKQRLKDMTRRLCLETWQHAGPVVLPSLLQCDFGNLEREVRSLEEAGVKALHLDVMDGVFVPNLTYGMPIVAALRRLTDMPLDVHLMIQRPEDYLRQFHEAGADVL